MTKYLVLLALLALAASPALAVDSRIVPEFTTLEPNDVELVDYCVSHAGSPLPGTAITVTTFCKDHNGLVGCQVPPDDTGTAELSVAPLDAVTGADGCGDVQLTTTGASGTFYYTLSGSLGGSQITRETGTAVVPEFSTFLGAAALAASGLLVWRKKNA